MASSQDTPAENIASHGDGAAADEAGELDSSAIAAAMGFSSFGTQPHPKKRRRFNRQADIVVAAAPAAAPSLPLHPPRVNTDEIDLAEDDGNDEHAANSSQLDGSALSKARHGQATVAAATDNLFRAADRHGFRSELSSHDGGGRSSHDWDRRYGSMTGLEAAGHSRGRKSYGGGQDQQERRDRHVWWTNYYDPMSNQNPWARLEAQLGLPAVGTWLGRSGSGPAVPAALPAAPAGPVTTA